MGARRRAAAVWLLAGAAALPTVAACRPSGPPVQMVQGVVTLDGRPIEGVAVTFTPVVAGGSGIEAFGNTGADGSYTLSAFRGAKPGSGTLIGEYVVTCAKVTGGGDPAEVPPPRPDAPDTEVEKWRREEAQRRRTMRAPLVYVVPQAYGDGHTSGLRATVEKGHNSGARFRFDLKSGYTGK
jgi:hypothetical protein